MADTLPRMRIGELSRRTGVSPELLRAWETRYRLLRPRRSAGGFRLYSELDESRIRRMRALTTTGLSAAEAARSVLREETAGAQAALPPAIVPDLDHALLAFDELAAHTVLDRLFATTRLEVALTEAILPELRAIGERWAAGELTVEQEHFAATLIRGRLLGLARGWDRGRGPRAILACVPGEFHDIGLLAFGLVLRRRGWRIVYLGQDTPLSTLEKTARQARVDLVVASAVVRRRFADAAHDLARLALRQRVAIGGAGATPDLAAKLGARFLGPDLITAADSVTVRDA